MEYEANKLENHAVSNLLMSGWEQEWMLRDQLKSQGTIYLSEDDLQDVLKEDGAS